MKLKKILTNNMTVFLLAVAVLLSALTACVFYFSDVYKQAYQSIEYQYKKDYGLKNYHYAIKKGTLEKATPYNATVVLSESVQELLPATARLVAKVGEKILAGGTVYFLENTPVSFDLDSILTSAENQTDGILISYRALYEDTIRFEADKIYAYTYRIGDFVRVKYDNQIFITSIAAKKLEDGKSVFFTQKSNYVKPANTRTIVEVIENILPDALFISNAYLTNSQGDGQYLLDLCNVHAGKEPIFSSEMIRVEYYNDDYSLIVEGNVFTYQMVYRVYW